MSGLAAAIHLYLNSQVTQANIRRTICVRGWTATIRPPASYTTGLKRKQLPVGARLADYEEDHYTSLELGGSPTDPHNLWPQRWPDARRKDVEEDQLHKAVCSGRMSLQAAQVKLAADWPR